MFNVSPASALAINFSSGTDCPDWKYLFHIQSALLYSLYNVINFLKIDYISQISSPRLSMNAVSSLLICSASGIRICPGVPFPFCEYRKWCTRGLFTVLHTSSMEMSQFSLCSNIVVVNIKVAFGYTSIRCSKICGNAAASFRNVHCYNLLPYNHPGGYHSARMQKSQHLVYNVKIPWFYFTEFRLVFYFIITGFYSQIIRLHKPAGFVKKGDTTL